MTRFHDPSIGGLDWEPDFDTSQVVSMGVGPLAEALATAHSEEGLSSFARTASEENWRVFILGGGSNTIFCGERFEGVLLRLGREFSQLSVESENQMTAGASALMSSAVNLALKHGLGGLEFGAGIPGQIGGALAGNAGQGGESICDLAETVWGMNWRGERVSLGRGEFSHGYRRSGLSQVILLGAKLLLKSSKANAITVKMEKFLSKRWEQPTGVRSSGCIFKNPEGDVAGRLIEAAGLKGFSIGGAEVSAEHANFILNRGNAGTQEVVALINHVRETVKDRSGVALEMEVRLVS